MQANGIAQAVLFSCLLLAASVWDIRKRIIPNSLCALIALMGLHTFTPAKLFGVLLGLPLLIAALLREGGMGGGDIKLTAACGFVLGLTAGCAGLILGLFAALIWYVFTLCVRRLKRMPTPTAGTAALPLAPFLSIGFITTAIFRLSGGLLSMV